METTYKGIDYGLGKSNIDDNNIRFGVINQSEVLQAWCDDSDPMYFYCCPECGIEFGYEYPGYDNCPNCYELFDEFTFDMLEPDHFRYLQDGYKIFQSQDDTDLFVELSPYYTYAQFCSPCAPGAIYLMSPLDDIEDNNKGYCLGHDWFESGYAPYPVYDIKSGKRVAADGSLMD